MFKNEKRTFKWAIASKFLCLMLLLAGGCKENPQTAIALNPQTNECPQTPHNALTPNNVKELSLGPQNLKESGTLRVGKSLGYLFKAELGQQLNYRTDEDICIWVYAPNNELVVGTDLPISGNYTIQLSTLKGVTTFTLEMRLESLYTADRKLSSPRQNSPPNSPTNTSQISYRMSEAEKAKSLDKFNRTCKEINRIVIDMPSEIAEDGNPQKEFIYLHNLIIIKLRETLGNPALKYQVIENQLRPNLTSNQSWEKSAKLEWIEAIKNYQRSWLGFSENYGYIEPGKATAKLLKNDVYSKVVEELGR